LNDCVYKALCLQKHDQPFVGRLSALHHRPAENDSLWGAPYYQRMSKDSELADQKEAEMPSAVDREKSLETALAQIDRQFGKGSVMRLGSDDRAPVEVIPTGSIALDVALGIGGLPRGRIVEIYGPESSGKTTLTLHAIANAQRAGGIAAFIDAEHALDPEYAAKLGVDIDALLVSQPDTGEQALEIADMLVRSGSIDVIVIDSVAALVPRAEIEGEMGDAHVGLQARLMSQALRKLTGGLSQTNTTMIFINQLREKIGVFFGSPETTAGGKALKFYASVRLDIRRIETLKDGTDAVGNRTRVKVVKNKMAPPFKQAEFDILYGTGISREGSLIDFGVDHEIVRKSGAWYTYDGDQLGQGKENSRKFLLENPEIALDIEQKIMFKLGVGAEAKAAKATAAADALQAQNALQVQSKDAKAAKEPAGPTPIEVVPTPAAEEEFPPESEFETSLKAVGE
jgi:recombination protein RecA